MIICLGIQIKQRNRELQCITPSRRVIFVIIIVFLLIASYNWPGCLLFIHETHSHWRFDRWSQNSNKKTTKQPQPEAQPQHQPQDRHQSGPKRPESGNEKSGGAVLDENKKYYVRWWSRNITSMQIWRIMMAGSNPNIATSETSQSIIFSLHEPPQTTQNHYLSSTFLFSFTVKPKQAEGSQKFAVEEKTFWDQSSTEFKLKWVGNLTREASVVLSPSLCLNFVHMYGPSCEQTYKQRTEGLNSYISWSYQRKYKYFTNLFISISR